MVGLGPGCRGQWKIGDAVMALLSGGGQAEYVTVPEGCLMPVPKDLTFTQAAAIPEAWITAFQLLHFVGEKHICKSIPPKEACLLFCSEILSFLPPPVCCLPPKNLFSVSPFTWVRIWYARHKSSNLDHMSQVTTYSADCIIYKEGYGKMVSFLFICIS